MFLKKIKRFCFTLLSVAMLLSSFSTDVYSASKAQAVHFLMGGTLKTNGNPNSYGKVYFYTSSAKTTYMDVYDNPDKTGSVLSMPIVLDVKGEYEAYIDGQTYVEVYDKTDVLIDSYTGPVYKAELTLSSFVVDVLAIYGNIADGDPSTGIDKAITDLDSSKEYEFWFSGEDQEYIFSADTTFPSNVSLVLFPGSYFTNSATLIFEDNEIKLGENCYISNSDSLLVSGNIYFSNNAYITNSSVVTLNSVNIYGEMETNILRGVGVYYGSVNNAKVYPEWFGATGDGETDDYSAISNAKDLAESSLRPLYFKSVYECNTGMTFSSGTSLIFNQSAMIENSSATIDMVINCSIEAGITTILSGNITMSGETKAPYIYPEWFGAVGDGETDDYHAIQKALGYDSYEFKTLFLSNKDYLIKNTLEVRSGTSIKGANRYARITADFSDWGGPTYNALHINGRTGSDIEAINWGQYFRDFCVSATGNSTIESTGIIIGSYGQFAMGSAINYALFGGKLSNLLIERFDTGVSLHEFSESTFDSSEIWHCRVGLDIYGKCVSDTFTGLQILNPSKAYTSSTDDTYAMFIRSSTRYAASTEGRPEGLMVNDSLLYGCVKNLALQNVLFFRIKNSVIDAGHGNSIEISNVDNIGIENCYIGSLAPTASAIYFVSIVDSKQKTNIVGNYFVGTCQHGIYLQEARSGITIANNYFYRHTSPIYVSYLSYSQILNNYAYNCGSPFIQVISGGKGLKIDGNNIVDGGDMVLALHPDTSEYIDVGANFSPSQNTYFQGIETIATGNNYVDLDNNFWPSGVTDNYVRAITTVSLEADNGSFYNYYIEEDHNDSAARLHVTPNATDTIRVRYKARAIPYSGI